MMDISEIDGGKVSRMLEEFITVWEDAKKYSNVSDINYINMERFARVHVNMGGAMINVQKNMLPENVDDEALADVYSDLIDIMFCIKQVSHRLPMTSIGMFNELMDTLGRIEDKVDLV